MGMGSDLRSQYDWITQNSFRAPTSQVTKRDTGFQEMVEACPAKIRREKIPARQYGLENCRKCRLSILKQFFA